jgi:hypothetical protein
MNLIFLIILIILYILIMFMEMVYMSNFCFVSKEAMENNKHMYFHIKQNSFVRYKDLNK